MIGKLSAEEIDRLLAEQSLGHLACAANGRPYVVPMSYVYDSGMIYGHTREGLKLEMLRANPEVCFQVEAIAAPSSWRSVVISGHFEELEHEAASKALHALIAHLQPALGSRAGAREGAIEQLAELAQSQGVVFRIVPYQKSGRFESEGEVRRVAERV